MRSVAPFVGVDKMFILYIAIDSRQIVNTYHDSTLLCLQQRFPSAFGLPWMMDKIL
jgi:hypothetical protein